MVGKAVNSELYEKFLKQRKLEVLDIGEYIPDIELQDPIGNSYSLYEFITDHLLVFFFSTECESCIQSMEALHEFSQTSSPVNLIVLIHTTIDQLELIKTIYPPDYKIFVMDKHRMHNELRTYRLPRCLMLNKLGQVLAVNSCSDSYWIGKAVEPVSLLIPYLEMRE